MVFTLSLLSVGAVVAAVKVAVAPLVEVEAVVVLILKRIIYLSHLELGIL
jgi:hypothetical protein